MDEQAAYASKILSHQPPPRLLLVRGLAEDGLAAAEGGVMDRGACSGGEDGGDKAVAGTTIDKIGCDGPAAVARSEAGFGSAEKSDVVGATAALIGVAEGVGGVTVERKQGKSEVNCCRYAKIK